MSWLRSLSILEPTAVVEPNSAVPAALEGVVSPVNTAAVNQLATLWWCPGISLVTDSANTGNGTNRCYNQDLNFWWHLRAFKVIPTISDLSINLQISYDYPQMHEKEFHGTEDMKYRYNLLLGEETTSRWPCKDKIQYHHCSNHGWLYDCCHMSCTKSWHFFLEEQLSGNIVGAHVHTVAVGGFQNF